MSTQSGSRPSDEDPASGWYLRMIRRYLGPGPYLDYGCGEGRLLQALTRYGPCTGFERTPDTARAARRAAPGCPVRTDPAELPDAAFRGLVALDVLTDLDDTAVRATLSTWRRVLRPGGRALVAATDGAGRARELAAESDDDPAPVARSHDRYRELLESAGFEIVREGSDGLSHPPYGRVPTALDPRILPAILQRSSGRLYLAPGSGEAALFVVKTPL